MATSLPQTTISCAQCGGELFPDEGQLFLTCPYCSSAVYLDKSRVVFHWCLAPTLDEKEARGALARWMAGNETVKDLDKKAQVGDYAFEYFPVWYFKRRDQNGREQVLLEPAAATSISEIRNISLPAGDLRKYEDQLGGEAHTPNVPLEAALEWLEGRGVPGEQIVEQSLVHIPLYTFKYAYQKRPYTAVVEAGTGSVFANIFPAKAEAPYMLAGGLTATVFLCLALILGIGIKSEGKVVSEIGMALCAGVAILAAPVLFALAAWVAAKT